MKTRWLYVIPAVILTIIVSVLGYGLSRDPRRVPSPLIDKPAPQFSLPRLMDPARSLTTADLVGQVSIVNVWASWCYACRTEHPVLMDLANRDLIPLYAFDYKDTRTAAKTWLARRGNPYTAIGFEQNGNVGMNWGVYGVPETYVLDQRGIIRHKFIGPLTPKLLDQVLIPLIRQLQRAKPGQPSKPTLSDASLP